MKHGTRWSPELSSASSFRFLLSLSLSLSAAALLVASVALMKGGSSEKVGVVRTTDVVAKYKAMGVARRSYEERRMKWQSDVDTLEADYQRSASRLEARWNALSAAERKEETKSVTAQEQNLISYVRSLEKRIDDEERRLSEEFVTKVNDAVRRFAEDHGYDVIYGATIEGSILYSNDALDITDELIDVLNNEYDAAHETDTLD